MMLVTPNKGGLRFSGPHPLGQRACLSARGGWRRGPKGGGGYKKRRLTGGYVHADWELGARRYQARCCPQLTPLSWFAYLKRTPQPSRLCQTPDNVCHQDYVKRLTSSAPLKPTPQPSRLCQTRDIVCISETHTTSHQDNVKHLTTSASLKPTQPAMKAMSNTCYRLHL